MSDSNCNCARGGCPVHGQIDRTVLLSLIPQSYGKVRYLPQNLNAQLFAQLLGQKTLTLKDLVLIKELGYFPKTVTEEL